MSRQNMTTMELDEIITNEGLQLVTSQILKHLDLKSLNRCRQVSQKWKSAVEEEDCYWDLCLQVIIEKFENVESICGYEDRELAARLQYDWIPMCSQEAFKKMNKSKDEFKDFVRFLQRFLLHKQVVSPLEYAAQNGNIDIIKLGMEKGFAFETIKSPNSLHYACQNGQEEIVRYIFEHCSKGGVEPVDLNKSDPLDGYSPFEHACQSSNLDLLDFFFDSAKSKGIKLSGSALIKASPECFKILIERASELDFDQESKNRLLHKHHSKEDFQSLLDINGIVNFDFNATDTWGRTPLLWACMEKNQDMFEMLLKYSKIQDDIVLDLDAKTEGSEQTVLHFACWHRDPIMLSILLKYCADDLDFAIFNAQGWTPLHYAVCNPEVMKLLNELDTKGLIELDFGMKDRSGRSLLQSVLHAEHSSDLQYFLDLCQSMGMMDLYAYTEWTDEKGCTVWHEAVRNRNYLQMLMDFCKENGHEIELNAIDHCDRTPLHHACLNQDFPITKETVVLLLEQAKETFIAVNARDDDGRTPIYLACMTEARLKKTEKQFKNTFSPFRYLLENSIEYGINLNIRDKNGLTMLHWLCCSTFRYGALQVLLESAKDNCLDLNPLDEEGNHPLHLACQHGNYDIVQLLLESSSDLKICLNPTDATGRTPLHIACIENKPKVVKTILKYSKSNGGINLNVREEEGLTAYDCADREDHWEIVELFRTYAKQKWVH